MVLTMAWPKGAETRNPNKAILKAFKFILEATKRCSSGPADGWSLGFGTPARCLARTSWRKPRTPVENGQVQSMTLSGVVELPKRTGCDGLRPQLVVPELVQVSLHEATGLDGLERHQGIGVTVICGGRERKRLMSRP